MTDATVPRRFGFKRSSIPTSTTSSVSTKNKKSTLHSTDIDDSTSDTKMNGVPIDIDVRVLEKFEETFGEETVAAIEQLLAFRYNTNKFAVKARKEEQINYIKKLKAVVGDILSKIREFSNLSAAMDDKITAIKTALWRILAVLEHAAKTKDHSEAERRQLKGELDTMQKIMKQICASQLEAISMNEIQLEEAKRLNEQMKVTLKSYEARMVEESRRFREEKRDIEHMHEKKRIEEIKRKQNEVEKLQDQISKTRE
ncbi:hypothetical protein PsorP6_000597 [Peronosclerospora sorghi]|uniref:Uncharacterized protein n=1 Tax=Peronosclerospora sorghi TaxID=230839 RepID=A0ACC0WY88_9STRA|nr:hypothetical protein PsorP6_000597 [Peronosclerospora sorghi]